MITKQRYCSLLVFGFFALFATLAYGFKLDESKWPESRTTFHVGLAEGGVWDDAFEQAADKWNSATVFTFTVVKGSFVDPCQDPNEVTAKNGVKFDTTFCGVAFGEAVLALEQSWSLGTTFLQSGIVFNSNNVNWDVYDGPHSTGVNANIKDFRRIAVHELGHSLGLEHEDTLPSIMDALLEIGSQELGPQGDDIDAVATIYGVVDANVVLVSAVLPSSRSVTVGATATAFATIINGGSATASNCWLTPITPVPADFFFQTTNPATNALTGTRNTAIDIAPGAFQTFVFGFTPTAAFDSIDVQIQYRCANANAAGLITGLNSLLLSASATPIPDIVALGATVKNDGIVHIPGTTGTGFFAVASVNVGSSDNLIVSVDTGNATLPIVTSLCQTDPATGACINPPTPATGNVALTINANETPTLAVFVAGTADIALDAAFKRIFLRFKDASGVTRGSTSVAVQTDTL